MADAEAIGVEVAYALPEQQLIIPVSVAAGTTVREAILRSGILQEFLDIDLDKNKVGVWGKLVKPNHVLRAGDRVEIYRPLIADPKQVRRERAAAGKAMRKGAGEKSGGSQAGSATDADVAPDS